MLRRLAIVLVSACALALPSTALAVGGNYGFAGGTQKERTVVRAALAASSFDWSIVPQRILIHIGPYGVSRATPAHIWLDGRLLAAGAFAWPTVMDEYAHQVDFFLLDDTRRQRLLQRLGGEAWCYEKAGVPHSRNGCERFTSMLAWAHWPSKESSYRPLQAGDESAAMPATEFRALLAELLGAPRAQAAPRALSLAHQP